MFANLPCAPEVFEQSKGVDTQEGNVAGVGHDFCTEVTEAFGNIGGGVADAGRAFADGECAGDVCLTGGAAAELVSRSHAAAFVGFWSGDAV